MYVNDFSVQVARYPGDPMIREGDAGYVHIEHGQQYKLRLRNNRAVRCDAEVFIDSKHVGTWRLEPRSGATIEHPAHDAGKFTAYVVDSCDGNRAGLTRGNDSNGLVQVVFRPEREYVYYYPEEGVKGLSFASRAATYMASVGESSTAVGTGLSGHSSQQYGSASSIQYDEGAAVTISLRLVHKDSGPRPLSPTLRGNPVPPPVK